MDDAELNLGIRVDRCNGIGESGQTIDAGNQDIFDTAVVEVGQDGEPEVGAFALGQVEVENLLLALQTDGQNCLNCLTFVATVVLDLVMDCVEPDEGVQALQEALLPLPGRGGYDLVCNGAQRGCGDLDAVQILDLNGNVTVAHAEAVHR